MKLSLRSAAGWEGYSARMWKLKAGKVFFEYHSKVPGKHVTQQCTAYICLYHFYENMMAKNIRMEMVTTAPRMSRDLMLSKNALLFAFLLDFWKPEKIIFSNISGDGRMLYCWYLEEERMMLFKSNTWKMTVPCSSFSARDSISCSFPSLMMISMLMRKLMMISMMMMTITFQAASPHCFAWYLPPLPPVEKIMPGTFLLFLWFFVYIFLITFYWLPWLPVVRNIATKLLSLLWCIYMWCTYIYVQ